MRRIWLLIISLTIFLLSSSFFSAKSYAQVEDLSASPSSASESEVNYELPYPGLLPDNPLYFLRVTRDWAVGLLISDPLKKAEFNLLQADKRLNAGIYLFNKGKISLALSTVSKAENYFSEGIDKLEVAKIEGKDVGGMYGKMRDALRKHEQELKNLVKKTNLEFKQNFQNELKRIMSSKDRLSN
jgi:hypothetical protein